MIGVCWTVKAVKQSSRNWLLSSAKSSTRRSHTRSSHLGPVRKRDERAMSFSHGLLLDIAVRAATRHSIPSEQVYAQGSGEGAVVEGYIDKRVCNTSISQDGNTEAARANHKLLTADVSSESCKAWRVRDGQPREHDTRRKYLFVLQRSATH